tara:strand:+ start:47697 stop:51014 length:3318 start_codon:yes stop_codon:yes gene_type:complete
MENFTQINVENLLLKIESFYKRFYLNKLTRGIFISLGIILAFFLVFDLLFYYVSLPTFVRFTVFYSLIVVFLSAFYFWILIPILRLFHLRKGISNEEASRYIGNHFTEIDDKLLNIVQFLSASKPNELALAAVEQKSQFFEPFEFTQAAPQISENKKVFFFLLPLSFILGLYFFNARIITEGSTRIYHYEVDYSNIAPFDFSFTNTIDEISKGSSINLGVKLIGDEIPSEVFIKLNGVKYRTVKSNDEFYFIAKNVSENITYSFEAGGYTSTEHNVQIVKQPKVSNVLVTVKLPPYMNKEPIELINPSDIQVYAGSKLYWNMEIEEAAHSRLWMNDSLVISLDQREKILRYTQSIDKNVQVKLQMEDDLKLETIGYTGEIVLITDERPKINVKMQLDSIESEYSFFVGSIQDDFGFHSLLAKFSSEDSNWVQRISIPKDEINHVFSFQLPNSKLVSSTKVVFEVRDNDAIMGYKMTKSNTFTLSVLSDNQKDSATIEKSKELEKELNSISKDAQLLGKEMKAIQKELLTKKQLDWDDQKKLEKLVSDKKDLDNRIKDSHEKINEQQRNKNEKETNNENILEKKKQLDDLYKNLIDEETKKLYEELEKLLEQMNKEKIQDHMEKMKLNQEDLEKELDRNLEIFKQLELEKGLEKNLEKLDKLAQKQLDLSEKSKELNSEENIKKQEELTKEFEDFKKEMDRLDSLNKELKEPNELDTKKQDQEEISREQEKATENAKEGKQQESSENQKDAGEKMKEMKEDMENGMEMSSSSQEGEDLDALRNILENLLVLSFNQEEIMNSVKKVDRNDPRVVTLNQDQRELLDDSKMVKDSLYALSVRVPQIKTIITKEVKSVTHYMDESVKELAERRLPQTSLNQQKSLTSINNLAVLLDEIIQQMQEQQKKKKKGSGSCSKPGSGKPKPSLSNSKKRQQELAKQIEALKKKMEKGEKGKTPGKKNPGQMGNGMSKELAQMAAQQERIREEIRKMSEQLGKEGNLQGAGELKKLEELLEKNEENIINMELDNEFFSRQQDIEVKMLQAENAQRQREKDNQRKSETAQNYEKENASQLKEYAKMKEFELELIRMFNPQLSGYYKDKVQSYNSSVK